METTNVEQLLNFIKEKYSDKINDYNNGLSIEYKLEPIDLDYEDNEPDFSFSEKEEKYFNDLKGTFFIDKDITFLCKIIDYGYNMENEFEYYINIINLGSILFVTEKEMKCYINLKDILTESEYNDIKIDEINISLF